jgi:recombinational DNA repair protein (RecF pathway)
MYQKYQTDALILASREQGEADRVYALYTRDFGLVRAKASAVRREASRMRYALQNYSFANVSLIRGKRSWRVGGARPLDTLSIDENIEGVKTFARIADLATRLVAGEEKNEYLYETLYEARKVLTETLGGDTSQIGSIEIVCVARILYTLGYISPEALQTTLFAHTTFGLSDLQEAEQKKSKLLASINHALSETQLVRR